MDDKIQAAIDSLDGAEKRLAGVWADTESGFRAAAAKLSGRIAKVIDKPIADRLAVQPTIPMYDDFREKLIRPIAAERKRILEILQGPVLSAVLTGSPRNPTSEPFESAVAESPVEEQAAPLDVDSRCAADSAIQATSAEGDFCIKFPGQPPLDTLPPATTTVANVEVAADKLMANLGVVGMIDLLLVFGQLAALLVQHYQRWREQPEHHQERNPTMTDAVDVADRYETLTWNLVMSSHVRDKYWEQEVAKSAERVGWLNGTQGLVSTLFVSCVHNAHPGGVKAAADPMWLDRFGERCVAKHDWVRWHGGADFASVFVLNVLPDRPPELAEDFKQMSSSIISRYRVTLIEVLVDDYLRRPNETFEAALLRYMRLSLRTKLQQLQLGSLTLPYPPANPDTWQPPTMAGDQ